MKILIYGLHFKPDLIGIGKYTGEMTDWLFDQGNEMKVITAPSYYPEWKLKYNIEDILQEIYETNKERWLLSVRK